MTPDKLHTYRAKRDFEATPEPAGDAAGQGETARFVIQEHHATRLHWDLRLEHDGVLASWAIPNGIPADPSDNRLAVHTEDHPLEYLDFHGEIPAGEYGAGTMTIWDHGTFETHLWDDKKVEITFHGERLSGRYGLFPIGQRGREGSEKDWMIHRMDPPADPDREPMPERILPMLAGSGELPAREEKWSFEVKWDGVRAIAYVKPGRLRLESRNLNEITETYPEVRGILRDLGMREAVFDGEIVAFGDDGRPSFERLQRRMQRLIGQRRAPPGGEHPGRLRDLRPALPRRPLADGAALRATARAARGAGAGRPGVAGAGGASGARQRAARCHRGPGPGGRRGQAAGLPL